MIIVKFWICFVTNILPLLCLKEIEINSTTSLREAVKYYFADFVRKGGGGSTPQIRNPLFAENFVRKGGEGGTPQIRNLFL